MGKTRDRSQPEEKMQTTSDPMLGLSAVHSTLDLYKKQLLSGPRLDLMSDSLLGNLNGSLCKKYAKARYGSSARSVSLKDLTSEMLVDAITRTLFGNRIYGCEPNLVRNLLDFNDDTWMLVFKYPQSAASKPYVARDSVLKGFTAYVQSPAEVHSGQAWLIENVLSRQKSLDICDEDRAALLLMIYWAANINPYKLAVWMFTYILFDPQLHLALREETSQTYQNGAINLPYLLENCPRLDATYQQTLRVVNGALSVRKIVAPTPLCGKLLASGNTILIPFRQMHYNPAVFGDDPGRFDAERFLHDLTLKTSPSFMPFGGGVNYCPGRFLAKQEMLVFVALALNRFEIRLATESPEWRVFAGGQKFSELDTSTPALGVNGPVAEEDVFVDLGDLD